MPIYRGTNKIGEVYFGGNKIGKIYVGNNLVYNSTSAIYLGYKTSFTVTSSIYADYANLTIDDFFISPTEGDILRKSYTCLGWDGSSCTGGCNTPMSDRVTFTKTWDASTGTFNCSFGGQKVYAWIIPNSAQLISGGTIKRIGTGQGFNVSSIASDYKKCTKDNFLFRTLNPATSTAPSGCCSYNCLNLISFVKSYNQSTGDLSAHSSVNRTLSAGSLDTTPYYIPTSLL